LSTHELHRETFIRAPLDTVFQFFSDARNLAVITPPQMHFRILTPEPISLHAGAELRYTLRVRGIPVNWTTIIETWNPPLEFSDSQARGPYKLWRHTHRFRAVERGTMMEDDVRYALPFGPLGRLAHWLYVRRDLESIFDYRAARIKERFGA
jgi:ligand-binding SRPBCC domain-containing protein